MAMKVVVRAPRRHVGRRLVWRYVTGARMDGKPYTGSRAWSRLPRWRRAAWRLAVPGSVVGAGALAVVDEPAAVGVALVAILLALRWSRRQWRTWRFRRTYTRPTLSALRSALGDAPVGLYVDPSLGSLVTRLARPMSPAETAVRGWYGRRVEPVIRWAPDRFWRGVWALRRTARPVTRHLEALRRPVPDVGPRIELTASVPYLSTDQRQFVSAVISAKIPAGELVESWDQVGAKTTATWTVRRRPPASVGYADLVARLDQMPEHEFFVGLGVGSKPVTVSLADDSPHIAVSAGSGAGKSVLAQLIAVQVLARGGQVIVLDRKGSHRPLLGLSDVDYCTRPEQMHNALVRVAELADQRNAESLHQPEGWDPGPRVLIVCEEMNATIGQLTDWWTANRDGSDPKVSPSIRALREVLYMGRSAKVNAVGIAQMLSARAIGGPEARENFAVRCLARYTANAWKMLVPEARMPRPSRTMGRWQIVAGGVATETQVAFLTAAEARLLVAKYRGVPASPVVPGSPLMATTQEMSPGRSPADPLAETLTLRQAVDRGLIPWQFAAAKKRMQRGRAAGSPTVPAPAAKDGQADLYTVADMITWAEAEMAK